MLAAFHLYYLLALQTLTLQKVSNFLRTATAFCLSSNGIGFMDEAVCKQFFKALEVGEN